MATRRGAGEGSIYQRKDGRWCAAYTAPTGKRKYMYAATRRDAQAKLRKALDEAERGILSDGRTTVGMLLERWLRDWVGPQRRPRTYEAYEAVVRNHIAPCLGKIPLAKLGALQVQQWINGMVARGVSPKTVRYSRMVLGVALGRAMKWGLVAHNVARLTDCPEVTSETKRRALRPDELARFLGVIQSHRLASLFVVAPTTGLRISEALALRWGDVDLEARTLTVQQQLQWGKAGVWKLAPLKTQAGRRTVGLPEIARRSLLEHLHRQLDERQRAQDGRQDYDLIFCWEDGRPLRSDYVRKLLYRTIEQAGLTRFRFHDLRHTYATILRRRGVDIKTIQELMGHSSARVTMDIYGHVLPDDRMNAADQVDAALSAPQVDPLLSQLLSESKGDSQQCQAGRA